MSQRKGLPAFAPVGLGKGGLGFLQRQSGSRQVQGALHGAAPGQDADGLAQRLQGGEGPLNAAGHAPGGRLVYRVAVAVGPLGVGQQLAFCHILPRRRLSKAAFHPDSQHLGVVAGVQGGLRRCGADRLPLHGGGLHKQAAAGKVQSHPAEQFRLGGQLLPGGLQQLLRDAGAFPDAGPVQNLPHLPGPGGIQRAEINGPDKAGEKPYQHHKQKRAHPNAGPLPQPFRQPARPGAPQNPQLLAAAFRQLPQAGQVPPGRRGAVAALPGAADAAQPHAGRRRIAQKTPGVRPFHQNAQPVGSPKAAFSHLAHPISG